MLETLDYTIRIGSTPTFLYFDLNAYSYGSIPVKFNSQSLFIFKQFISLRVERCSKKKNNSTIFYRTINWKRK